MSSTDCLIVGWTTVRRSPLIYGGKVADITPANPHIAILTNPRVLQVSDNSTHNHQVKRSNYSAVWAANTGEANGSLYVGLFSLTGPAAPVSATFSELGLPSGVASAKVADLWSGSALAEAEGSVSADLSPCSKKSSGPCVALLRLSW